MKRPIPVMIVNLLQFLLGLLMAGTTVYLLTLTHSRETLAEPEATDTVHGLLIGSLVLGIPAVITLVGVVGMWKNRFWGWVLSLATNVGMLAVLVYNVWGESDRDGDEIFQVLSFVLPVGLLLLPTVRKFYWTVRPKSLSS